MQKDRKTETEVERCCTKRHEEKGHRERRSTRPENENSMCRPQMGNRLKKMIRNRY